MVKKTDGAELACSFCGKHALAVKLIAGPGILICAECVVRSVEIAREGDGGAPSNPPSTYSLQLSPRMEVGRREEPICTFCGEAGPDLVQPPSTLGTRALICNKCLELCQGMVKQDQAVFDRAFTAVREIVDMPDQRASLFVRLCMQHRGRLSAAKRQQFPELSDAEIAQLEIQMRRAIYAETAGL